MMGHRTSRYNDIKSFGVEYLRELYRLANLSIRPRPLTEEAIKIMQRTLRRTAERAGVSFPGEIYPSAYIEEAGESKEFDRLGLELETILKHLVARMLEAGGKPEKFGKIKDYNTAYLLVYWSEDE